MLDKALQTAGSGVAAKSRRLPQRTKLTDRYLKSLKPAADGKPFDVMDTVADRMGIRVMGTANNPVRTFVLVARFQQGKSPTRRALGAYVEPPDEEPMPLLDDQLLDLETLTLAEARAKAVLWLRMISRGIDPAGERESRRQAAIRRQRVTLNAVFDDWVRDKLSTERKGDVVARDVRREFLPTLGKRPISDITDLEILAVVNAKKRRSIRRGREKQGAPGQARNELGHIKRLFEWAIDQRVYGITVNPCASLKPGKILGKKKRGQRVLNEEELFALWRAVKRLPYPYRQTYQLLMLTALRLNEVARAPWTEFPSAVVRALRQRKKGEHIDWSKVSNVPLAWIIAAERMKGENDEAREHLVPLTDDMLAVLETLPLFKGGDYLFSTTAGKKPVCLGSKIKQAIDARMLRTLKALARRRGDDAAKVTLKNWTNHDIRRTVRSNLSRLRIPEVAAEAVLAHKRQGIAAVYDVYEYIDEKREALEFWAARLRSIVEPPPTGNVIAMKLPMTA